ncbi:hypothetical protein SCUCBS95973_008521 [Sporothrix curviconia]|uniref:Carboxylic ester hydrolase n=1 Tax=Sporothrix curviconia TaxID=1260050 RepID=A0ABP0CMU6_9PEZI
MAHLAPIRIAGGAVAGVPSALNRSITVYRGIPYAASTAGENRWRPPQPVPAWEGVRVADKFGPVCPQVPMPPAGGAAGGPVYSEDCLSVNVWTPVAPTTTDDTSTDESTDKRLPVFVWIYGGRFTSGAGSDPQFEGTGLAAQGVVVVTLNYRLGILGWLASTELSAASGHNASGNFGLLDQLAALQWVRDNIAAFGGDPAAVTLGGQSAGGASVGLHLLSPLSRGLFRGAINQSGFRDPRDPLLGGLSPAYRLKERAEREGDGVLAEKGVTSIAELRNLPLDVLLEGNNRNDTDRWGTPPFYRPCLDGYVFPLSFSDALEKGTPADIPVITGHNADEGGTYLDPEFTVDDLRACAEQKYGLLAPRFFELYLDGDDNNGASALSIWNEAARDNSRVTTALWAEAFHKHAASPVYGYIFTHAPPMPDPKPAVNTGTTATPMPMSKAPRNVYTYAKNGPPGTSRGAFHGAEVPYVFDNLDAQEGYTWTAADRAVAASMAGYWANFIKTGSPNGQDDSQNLPAFQPTNNVSIMALGQDNGMAPLAKTPERVAFWREHLARHPPF